MTRAEWIEITTIAMVATASWFVWPHISFPLPLWQIVLGLSALLLAQSLMRDIAILLRRRRAESTEPPKEAQCFCLESTVGATGMLAAALLAGVASGTKVVLNHWEFFLAVAGIMVISFIIKDVVIAWKPFGVRREPDHLNLIVRWKIKPK
jgi:hypothetical protein